MENAHLRMGKMIFAKTVGKSFNNFSVYMDRFIGERGTEQNVQGHLISVFGNDAQIAAVNAIISERESFTVEGPGLPSLCVNMDKDAECFRASVQISTSKRPLRHLVAVSHEFSTQGGTSGRTLLADSTPEYLWASLVHIFGLPAVPEWALWFCQKLDDNLALSRIHGLGCQPVLVSGSKEEYLRWLSDGIRTGEIKFPAQNGPTLWPSKSLKTILLPATDVSDTEVAG
jgi:hypothetical protein